MDRNDTPGMRKRLMSKQSSRPPERPGEIDIASRATVAYSSEDPAHPVEHLIDGTMGGVAHIGRAPGLMRPSESCSSSIAPSRSPASFTR